MNRFWSAAQASLLFLDPETAHEASLRALEAGVYPRQANPEDQRLAQTLFGLPFPNPVGVAAGYDKDARVYNALFDIGFGFAEAGTITPKPQAGNPRPRVLRLMRERGIINRLGFNSAGHFAALVKLASRPPRGSSRDEYRREPRQPRSNCGLCCWRARFRLVGLLPCGQYLLLQLARESDETYYTELPNMDVEST